MPGPPTVPVLDIRTAAPKRQAALWDALESSVNDLELALARAGQGVSALGVLIAMYVTVFVSRDMGLLTAVIAVVSLWWFFGVHTALSRGVQLAAVRIATPIYEILMPGGLLLAIWYAEGAEYALGSWVPPQLYAVFILMSILRLRPYFPTLLGVLAALEYGLLWYFFMSEELVGADNLLHRPPVQAVRMFSLVLTGMAGEVAVRGLRDAIKKANKEVRAKDLFGKYRLGKTIAAGGMGSVVHATYCPEGGFEREVAVKLIHPHLAQDQLFVRRFRNEAKLSARLAHPNIVPALDFGYVDGQYFFAMDFVDGPTLTMIQKYCYDLDAPVPLYVIAHIGREVAEALHHAHVEAVDGKGRVLQVVHRDVSPGNVMFHQSGQIRVLDFGVARALGDAREEHTKTLVGKPSYMAPEQLRADAVDARSDLFSLAVLLWELVCNRSLFRREHDGASMLAVVEDDIPTVDVHRPEVGPHWLAFFERALQRDPNRRFQTASALSQALAGIQDIDGHASNEHIAVMVARVLEPVDELELDWETEFTAEVDESGAEL